MSKLGFITVTKDLYGLTKNKSYEIVVNGEDRFGKFFIIVDDKGRRQTISQYNQYIRRLT